jgi:hypothetical protein
MFALRLRCYVFFQGGMLSLLQSALHLEAVAHPFRHLSLESVILGVTTEIRAANGANIRVDFRPATGRRRPEISLWSGRPRFYTYVSWKVYCANLLEKSGRVSINR